MADMTARFALPYIQPGQAQKEWFHNEALARIDTVLHPVVQAFAVADPPSAPLEGSAWIVGEAPTGDWVGHAGEIAVWTEGGWRFVAPAPGMTAWLSSAGLWLWHDGNAWRTDGWPCAGLMVGGAARGRCARCRDRWPDGRCCRRSGGPGGDPCGARSTGTARIDRWMKLFFARNETGFANMSLAEVCNGVADWHFMPDL